MTQTGCNSSVGAVDLSVSGGTGSYTYSWSTGSQEQDISNLPAGTYTVKVTDENGCSTEKNFYVTAQNTLRLSAVRTNTSCLEDNSGSIDLTVTGGTAPYSYNWSTNDITEDLSGLAAGFYQVTVTDSEGCSATLQAVIGSPSVNVMGTVTKPTCNGASDGSITLLPGVNEGSLTYEWSTGDTGASLTGLGPAVYSVKVTNEEGCEKTMTFIVSDPTPLSINAAVSNASCEDGSYQIDVTVSGGTGNFTYQWDDGITSEDRTSIFSGTYTVYVTDENGCIQEKQILVSPDEANCTDTEPTDPTDPDPNGSFKSR